MADIPEYLKSDCPDFPMCKADCGQAVKAGPARLVGSGRYVQAWYITMGHPGFNSPTNNGFGYASKARALAAIRYYSMPEGERRQMRDFGRSARIED